MKLSEDRIRVRAHTLSHFYPERSAEENWAAAVRDLRRPWFLRPRPGLWKWTGFAEKKGWDWIDLLTKLSLPLLVFFGGLWFNAESEDRQQRAAEEARKDAVLVKYFEQMTPLILEDGLLAKNPKAELRSVARAITLSLVRLRS